MDNVYHVKLMLGSEKLEICFLCHGKGLIKKFIDDHPVGFEYVCEICKKGYWTIIHSGCEDIVFVDSIDSFNRFDTC